MWENFVCEDDERIDAAFLRDQVFTLQRSIFNENSIVIFVSRCPSEGIADSRFYYRVAYRKNLETGKKWRIISKITSKNDVEIWKSELEDTANLVELSLEHFCKLRRLYKKEYTKVINDGPFSKYEEEDTVTLELLINIDTLEMDFQLTEIERGRYGITTQRWGKRKYTFFGLLRKDVLEFFKGPKDPYAGVPINKEDIEGFLYAQFDSTGNEMFSKLRAARVYMNTNRWTPENIFEFVKFWQKGKVRKNFEWCVWNFTNSNFDERKVMNLLNGGVDTGEPIVIKQHKRNGQTARIYCTNNELRFFCDEVPKTPEVRSLEKIKLGASQLSQNIRKFSKIIFKSPLTEKSNKNSKLIH